MMKGNMLEEIFSLRIASFKLTLELLEKLLESETSFRQFHISAWLAQ